MGLTLNLELFPKEVFLMKNIHTIVVVGLGYVGLPLAHAFSKHFRVIGYDLSEEKIALYRKGIDPTNELGNETVKESMVEFTNDPQKISEGDFIVVAVPTPVNQDKTPDLSPVESASRIVGSHMKKGAVIVYESTVYPGVTENICAPILEKESGMTLGADFQIGYSPERINPGDKVHTLRSIVKIVSGMDEKTLETVKSVYGTIIEAGVYPVSSILVAEAAKLVENAQRDINIAFMNELAIAFHLMHIDTNEVLKAMNTKWNALGFRPGLVGGHCIGVDPYYFIYQAEKLGYHSKIIGAGRRINDSMSGYVVKQMVKEMIRNHVDTRHAKIYLLGMTFKEDCPDVRNSRAVDIFHGLKEMGFDPIAVDPAADQADFERLYHVPLVPLSAVKDADVIAVLVAHKEFKALSSAEVRSLFVTCPEEETPLLFDVKSIYDPKEIRGEGLAYWNL